MTSVAFSRVASEPCHGWRRSPRKGRRITQNHGLLRSCGGRPSIRLTSCIGRGDEIHVPSPLPRAPILCAALRPGPAHVVQLRPVGVEQDVREGAEQPRSAAMEESVDLCIHVSGPSCVPTLVAIRQVPVLFIGVNLCFEARVSRRGTTREQPWLRARLGARGGCFSSNKKRRLR
jgi:hypothetical protein